MSDNPSFYVPCPHERPGTNASMRYSDHHPLTRAELLEILEYAAKYRGNGQRVSQAQVRLVQAVAGMTCPHPGAGPVSQAKCQLENLFVDWVKGADPASAVIDRIARLIVVT